MNRYVYLHALLPLVHAIPLRKFVAGSAVAGVADNETGSLTYLLLSIGLVLLGGIFAGLTLGLMGQDEIYLKVISTSGTPQEQQLSRRVLSLLARGKHQILVTLLLSNVITNETLPIVLDRLIGENGGGWKAILFSTVLIVVFGEIIPQSICVKYGLQIGSMLSPFVMVLMYLMWPIAWPIAQLLDYMLGENHGTMYKKSGLKTLVNLHQTNGIERLTQDEVTIITAVLDLKDKFVSEIMTPIDRVFTLCSNTVLNENTVNQILNSGFSRIPIHLPNEHTNFIGMLLVKILISYDPEDALKVSQFPLATLPETLPQTSSLNILNYFQQGKSHMCIVSKSPGKAVGAVGIVTLEDVIEELIGEEIIDESDVIEEHQLIPVSVNSPLITPYVPAGPGGGGSHRGSYNNSLSKIPSNLASNPLDVENSFVKIKRNYTFGTFDKNHSPHTSIKNLQRDSISASPILINGKKQIPGSNTNTIENNNGIVESVITIKGVPKTIIQSTDLSSAKNIETAGLLVVQPDMDA